MFSKENSFVLNKSLKNYVYLSSQTHFFVIKGNEVNFKLSENYF